LTFKMRREEPPVKKVPTPEPGRIDREVARLKKNPGVWYKIRENAAAGAYRVYRARGCETRTVSLGDQRYDIYAMYPVDGD